MQMERTVHSLTVDSKGGLARLPVGQNHWANPTKETMRAAAASAMPHNVGATAH